MTDLNNDNETTTDKPFLTPVEARVLGALMEKQRTTPDNYPMTLNALVQACNQKTSRHPVMQLEPGEVGHTLNELRDRNLVAASFAGRAERYDHKMVGALDLDRQEQAVLCVLMLRGSQTVGELRTNGGRMAEFADLSAVNDTLELLMAREPALVVRLPRIVGKREDRFAHLLCGEPDVTAVEASAAPKAPGNSRVAELEDEVRRLRAEIEALWEATGLAGKRPVN